MNAALKADNDNTPKYLTAEQLRQRWGGNVSVRTLSNWRSLGTGPKFTKLGGRVVYPLHEVEAFEARRTTDSTANYSK